MNAGDRGNLVIACIFGNEIFIVHSLFETITHLWYTPRRLYHRCMFRLIRDDNWLGNRYYLSINLPFQRKLIQ